MNAFSIYSFQFSLGCFDPSLPFYGLPRRLSACLVTKQCLMVFGRQTFPVCPGPYTKKDWPVFFLSSMSLQTSNIDDVRDLLPAK